MKKSENIPNSGLYMGLVILLLINLVQAIFTEINPDEAYYAYWSEHLDFGYYDHPPMVAVIIRLSSLLLNGNLGVRLVTLILQPLTLLITWRLCDPNNNMTPEKRLFVFFITASAMTMMTAYGFITTPDVPLLFFTSLLLYAYKMFLNNNNRITHTFLLAVAMAGLIYSKYQGAIVILLILFSNIRLITNKQFMLAATIGVLLCIPHFFWQLKNNFPSFQYHLFERSKGFNWSNILEYIPNQLATFNPFVFGAMVWLIIKYRVSNLFERALFFIIIGLILFFWVASFRGHAEPHWTVAASIPALILIVNYSAINMRFHNYVRRFVGASLLLIFIIRILLMTDLLPARLELCGKKPKYTAIEEIAKNTPVVFTGSFQSPSLYHFFTGNHTTVVSSLYTRQTQFDIWKKDRQLYGKKVFLFGEYGEQTKEYRVGNQTFKGLFIDHFQSIRDLTIRFGPTKKTYHGNEKVQILIEVGNTGEFPVIFNHPELPVSLNAVFSGKNIVEVIKGECSDNIVSLNPGDRKKIQFSFTIPELNAGSYKMGFSCSNLTGPGFNSRFVNITLLK